MKESLWKYSHELDDADIEMYHRDFCNYSVGQEYYGVGYRTLARLAHEAGAVYKIGKMVRIRRDIFEAYLRKRYLKAKEEGR